MKTSTELTFVQQLLVEVLSVEDDDTLAVQADLCYDSCDPLAVTVDFHTASGDVCWTFGRDLLAGGLREPTGDGDVHTWPDLDEAGTAVIVIDLCSPGGEVLLRTSSSDVSRFVHRSNHLVPPGTESEHLDVDAAIGAILASELA